MFETGEDWANLDRFLLQVTFTGHSPAHPSKPWLHWRCLLGQNSFFQTVPLCLPSCKGPCFVLLMFSSKCLTEDAPRITASETTKWLARVTFLSYYILRDLVRGSLRLSTKFSYEMLLSNKTNGYDERLTWHLSVVWKRLSNLRTG